MYATESHRILLEQQRQWHQQKVLQYENRLKETYRDYQGSSSGGKVARAQLFENSQLTQTPNGAVMNDFTNRVEEQLKTKTFGFISNGKEMRCTSGTTHQNKNSTGLSGQSA